MAELEPVEIDINMRQNVSDESARASKGMEDLAKSSQAAIDAMQKDIDRLNGVIDNMNTIIEDQKKQMSGNNEVYSESIKRLEEMEAELNRTKAALASYTDTSRQMIEASKEGANVTDIITDAKKNLSDTESALSGNMGELMDNQNKLNGSLDEGTKKVEIHSASNKILSVAIRSSCTALGIENTLITRSISNVGMIAAAKRGWATAVSILNTQLGLSVIASKALLAVGLVTGIGAILAVVGFLAYAFKSWNENTKSLTESMAEFNKASANGASKTRTEFEKLRQQWIAANGDLKTQEKLVRKNIEAYNSFGVEINNVNDADKMFVDNADAFILSINKRAMAAAAMELASKKYQEAIQKMLDVDNIKNNPTDAASFWQKAGSIFLSALPGRSRQSALGDILEDNIDDLETDAKRSQRTAINYIMMAMGVDDESNKILEAAGYKTTETAKKNSKKYFQEIRDYNQRLIDNMSSDELNSQDGQQAIKARDAAAKKLQIWDAKNSQRQETAAEKLLKQQQTAATKLEKSSVEYQKRIDAARIAAMQSGADKERTAIQTEYDQTKDYIMRELAEIARLETITEKPATTQRADLRELDKAAEAKYKAETARINVESEKAINDIFADVNQKFNSDLDNNLMSINRYYDDIIKKATLEGATLTQINELNSMRDKETAQARINNRLSQIDFDQEVATRRMEIADKVYLFEADREKDILSIQLDAAVKRRDALQEAYDNMPTDDFAKSLQLAGLEVDNLNKKIQKLPAQKFSQMVGFVNQIADSLGNVAGIDMSMLTGTLSGIEKFASGDMLGAASAGLGVVTGFLSGILNKGEREAQIRREILKLQQDYNISLRQQSYDLIQSIDYARAFRDNIEALHWLVEKGFISDTDYTAWEALNRQAEALDENILAAQKDFDNLNAKAADFLNVAYKDFVKGTAGAVGNLGQKVKPILNDWKNGIIDSTEALNRLSVVGFKGLGDLADQLSKAKEETAQITDQIVELQKQMDEFATGTSFDGFLSDSMSAIESLMTGVSELGDFTEDTLKKAVLSSFKYKVLASALEPLYNDLADIFLADEIDKNAVQNWSEQFNNVIKEASDKLGITLDALGLDLGSSAGSSTASAAKGITASQDSVNEVNGGLYAIRQSIGEIRNLNKEANVYQASMASNLDRISENTEYCRYLPDILRKLSDIESYGIPMK